MLLMIASLALLVLSGIAGLKAAKQSLWLGLLVALSPLVGIGLASATGQGLLAYAGLLPLVVISYRFRGTEFDVLLPLLGLVLVVALWNYANGRSRQQASAAYEAQVAAFRQQSEADAASAAGTVLRWPSYAAKLKLQGGRVPLSDTGAELDVPGHWRFIDAGALRDGLQGTKHFPGLGVIGWLVHERVDIAQLDTIWYVEVYAEQRGHVKAGGSDDGDLERRKGEATAQLSARALNAGEPSFSFVKFAELPKYDAMYDRASWINQMSYPGETSLLLDCYAIKLGKESQIWFRMREQFDGARELCLRSVRLLAGRTSYVSGAAYADYTWPVDDNSGFSLGEVIADEHRVDD
jgi:hypothetical protein